MVAELYLCCGFREGEAFSKVGRFISNRREYLYARLGVCLQSFHYPTSKHQFLVLGLYLLFPSLPGASLRDQPEVQRREVHH